jgi:hypothetical protein
MVVNKTKITYIIVKFMKFDTFGIGPVNLLLLKPMHIQGVQHTWIKKQTNFLTSNNLFPRVHQKSFVHGWF